LFRIIERFSNSSQEALAIKQPKNKIRIVVLLCKFVMTKNNITYNLIIVKICNEQYSFRRIDCQKGRLSCFSLKFMLAAYDDEIEIIKRMMPKIK
jgi:hypothetical protein